MEEEQLETKPEILEEKKEILEGIQERKVRFEGIPEENVTEPVKDCQETKTENKILKRGILVTPRKRDKSQPPSKEEKIAKQIKTWKVKLTYLEEAVDGCCSTDQEEAILYRPLQRSAMKTRLTNLFDLVHDDYRNGEEEIKELYEEVFDEVKIFTCIVIEEILDDVLNALEEEESPEIGLGQNNNYYFNKINFFCTIRSSLLCFPERNKNPLLFCRVFKVIKPWLEDLWSRMDEKMKTNSTIEDELWQQFCEVSINLLVSSINSYDLNIFLSKKKEKTKKKKNDDHDEASCTTWNICLQVNRLEDKVLYTLDLMSLLCKILTSSEEDIWEVFGSYHFEIPTSKDVSELSIQDIRDIVLQEMVIIGKRALVDGNSLFERCCNLGYIN